MEPKKYDFSGIAPFSLSVIHHPHILPLSVSDSHCHDQCEIYINLSGKVAFMVEGKLYPVERGDCIITRPFEYHHCVYQKMEPHEHYWILFSCAENEALLQRFFNRPAGVGNRIVAESKESFLRLCANLEQADSLLEKYTAFFALLQALDQGAAPKETDLPFELQAVLREINENFSAPLSIKHLAAHHFLSVSTLERQFKNHLGLSPKEYLHRKRLSFAANLLAEGEGVIKAALESGFSDPSYFIAQFKKQFGKTPLQYKKALEKN